MIDTKSRTASPAKAEKRRRSTKDFTVAQGRLELVRLDRRIAKIERLISSTCDLLETLRFDRALIRGCMEIVSKL